MRAEAALLALAVLALAAPAPAQGVSGSDTRDAPQSAIPWLSDSLAAPRTAPRPTEPAATPLTGTEITVMPLGRTRRDAVGLIARELTGLPRDTFAGSDPARLARLIARQPADAIPAMQDLVLMLLLAELDGPGAAKETGTDTGTATDPDRLFFARIDGLLRFGALDQAQALLERAGATDPEAFRRWWDTSLLTGFDTRACDAMTANPGVAPTLPARIFCLTRTGDWAAAALTLETGRALGAISDEDDRLLANFLDPELYEGQPPPVPPRPMTPLAFRLLDGIGETPPTLDLPLAFAVADLRTTTGWKAQIEAAERLTRVRALDPNRLLALYTEGRPSASGGVWDRAAAIQRLDTALLAGDAAAVADALPVAVARMKEAGLLVPFATLYGERLSRVPLEAAAGELALRVGLLSPAFESVGAGPAASLPRDRFAQRIATGTAADGSTEPGAAADGPAADGPAADGAPDPQVPPGTLFRAIADGFTGTPPDHLTRLSDASRLGEALFESALLLAGGAQSDPQDIADALAFFRANGLEDVARRTALQLLLL